MTENSLIKIAHAFRQFRLNRTLAVLLILLTTAPYKIYSNIEYPAIVSYFFFPTIKNKKRHCSTDLWNDIFISNIYIFSSSWQKLDWDSYSSICSISCLNFFMLSLSFEAKMIYVNQGNLPLPVHQTSQRVHSATWPVPEQCTEKLSWWIPQCLQRGCWRKKQEDILICILFLPCCFRQTKVLAVLIQKCQKRMWIEHCATVLCFPSLQLNTQITLKQE